MEECTVEGWQSYLVLGSNNRRMTEWVKSSKDENILHPPFQRWTVDTGLFGSLIFFLFFIFCLRQIQIILSAAHQTCDSIFLSRVWISRVLSAHRSLGVLADRIRTKHGSSAVVVHLPWVSTCCSFYMKAVTNSGLSAFSYCSCFSYCQKSSLS